jgi:hypothetical protein
MPWRGEACRGAAGDARRHRAACLLRGLAPGLAQATGLLLRARPFLPVIPTRRRGSDAQPGPARAGDKPEERWPEAAAELQAMGYSSTLDYVAAAAGAVMRETGLLPHVNAGVMGQVDAARCAAGRGEAAGA